MAANTPNLVYYQSYNGFGMGWQIHVVNEGDPMLVLEAMKMENVLRAAGEGCIGSILVSPGEAVEKDAVLISLAN